MTLMTDTVQNISQLVQSLEYLKDISDKKHLKIFQGLQTIILTA
jgi:hypothetical protein